jgi:predicted membrane-bound spermidine synthase
MLASFLLGIAIGGAVAARLARDRERAARGFAWAQVGTAALSMGAFLLASPLARAAESSGAGGATTLAANAVIAALGLLPSSLCIGAVIPFAVRLLARDDSEAGPATARVYAWNTVGSIAGALGSGFFLLPALRFEGTIVLAVALNLVLALVASTRPPAVARAVAALSAAGLATLLVVRPAPPWSVLRHSAMLEGTTSWQGDILYYGVGRSSTVLLLTQGTSYRITNNGLPESSIRRDAITASDPEPARWLGFLPVLLRPDLESMLIIGFGGGITVRSVPSSVPKVTVIELEKEVLRAHRWIADQGGSTPLDDPRVEVVVNDARGALQLTDARFGAIVSQPSHPWTAGASHLYTREFFELARQHLLPGGVFVQWIGLAFVDADLLRSLVATLHDVFPHVLLFRPGGGAVLFAASEAPLDPLATATAGLAAAPEDFRLTGLRLREDVATAWVTDSAGAAEISRGAERLTDDRNPLATHAVELGRIGRGTLAAGAEEFFAPFDPLSAASDGLDRGYLLRRLANQGFSARSLHLTNAESDPVQRLTTLGWVKLELYKPGAAAAFRAALAADPTSQSAAFGLLRSLREQTVEGDPELRAVAASLSGVPAAVVEGWGHSARGEWTEVRALDPILASASPADPAQLDALRLRIAWRAASDDAALRSEAGPLAVELTALSKNAEDRLLAARALAAAQRPLDALSALDGFLLLRRSGMLREQAVALLQSLRPEVDANAWESVHEQFAPPARPGARNAMKAPRQRGMR